MIFGWDGKYDQYATYITLSFIKPFMLINNINYVKVKSFRGSVQRNQKFFLDLICTFVVSSNVNKHELYNSSIS